MEYNPQLQELLGPSTASFAEIATAMGGLIKAGAIVPAHVTIELLAEAIKSQYQEALEEKRRKELLAKDKKKKKGKRSSLVRRDTNSRGAAEVRLAASAKVDILMPRARTLSGHGAASWYSATWVS